MPYKGQCFCGAVKIEADGEPLAMGYCHCSSCRAWSGTSITPFSLWKPEAVRVAEGEEHLALFAKTPKSERMFCRQCGGHLMARHPALNLTDILPPALPALRFEPQVHVNYQESVLRMRDGLPKFRDFPAEDGGSGELIPE